VGGNLQRNSYGGDRGEGRGHHHHKHHHHHED
jgi:hypothetical protein